jgi:hypothetical protein
MSDISFIAFVTRTNLNKAMLNINDKANFITGRSLRVGGSTWNHQEARSPYVHGRVVVHSTLDPVEVQLGVYVKANTMGALEDNLATLLEAFSDQHEFELHLTIDGVSFHWRCERADYEVGLITENIAARYLPVSLTMMRHPLAILGPI